MTLVLLAAITAAVIFLVRWRAPERRTAELTASLETLRGESATETAKLRQKITALEAEVPRPAKWETAANADETAAAMVQKARLDAEFLTSEAKSLKRPRRLPQRPCDVPLRTKPIGSVRRHAPKLGLVLDEANARLVDADRRARVVLDEANRRPEETAGDALKALRDAQSLERTVQALENIISGYGDRYVVPTTRCSTISLKGFGHTEAGQQLKSARERVRDAVRNGTAAVCDYVEESRRGTAIGFVVDAFSGKADSILARVRHDNSLSSSIWVVPSPTRVRNRRL